MDISYPADDPKGLIEHLAAAICYAGFGSMKNAPDDCLTYWRGLPEGTQKLYRAIARSWLPVIRGEGSVVVPRQPTTTMIDAVVGHDATSRSRKRAVVNYQQAIKARPKLFGWEPD